MPALAQDLSAVIGLRNKLHSLRHNTAARLTSAWHVNSAHHPYGYAASCHCADHSGAVFDRLPADGCGGSQVLHPRFLCRTRVSRCQLRERDMRFSHPRSVVVSSPFCEQLQMTATTEVSVPDQAL